MGLHIARSRKRGILKRTIRQQTGVRTDGPPKVAVEEEEDSSRCYAAYPLHREDVEDRRVENRGGHTRALCGSTCLEKGISVAPLTIGLISVFHDTFVLIPGKDMGLLSHVSDRS